MDVKIQQNDTQEEDSLARSSIFCIPHPSTDGVLDCTIDLAEAAPRRGVVVGLQSDSSRLRVPPQVQVPAGAQSAQFVAHVVASDRDEHAKIKATADASVRTIDLSITGIRPASVVCSPGKIQAGDAFTCTVRLNTPNIPEAASLAVWSDSPNLKIPASVATRPGQAQLDFKGYSDPTAKQQTAAVMVQFGQTSVADTVDLSPATAPILNLPPPQLTKIGKPLAFTVAATDPGGLPLVLSAGTLPPGASFDTSTGNFSWTSKRGTYDIVFTAANSANLSSTGDVLIQVDSGEPAIATVRNAASQIPQTACSPGSIASLVGRWLAASDQPVADPSGTSTQLAGTRVKVNGMYAPVLYASVGRIDFQCPSVEPGTVLAISAETEAGVANAVATTMQYSAPGLYSWDGSGQGQGLVTISGTSLLATSRTYQATGQPAEPGDTISILVTGIGSPGNAAFLQVKIADSYMAPDSVQAIPGMAGAYQVNVKVPGSVPAGDAIPVVLHIGGPDGNTTQSNTITIAIEPARF